MLSTKSSFLCFKLSLYSKDSKELRILTMEVFFLRAESYTDLGAWGQIFRMLLGWIHLQSNSCTKASGSVVEEETGKW